MLCQLYDHAKQYENECSSQTEAMEVGGNISRKGHGKSIIGRYGGCFEEDIIRLMCDGAYHIMGFVCTCKVCTTSRGDKGKCTVP